MMPCCASSTSGCLHILTYANAAALTAVAVLLYFAFYQYLKSDHPILSAIGLVFVPLYGIFNLLVYLSQITIVPILASRNAETLAQWLQIWPQSTIAILNQVAYTLLGISSILFGIAFIRKDHAVHLAAWLLILNGIACILGLIGVLIGNSLLGMGSLDWRRSIPGGCGCVGGPVSADVTISCNSGFS